MAATSLVRQQLGIALDGEANIQELRQALYYCADLYERIPIGKGRHYHVVDAAGRFMIVQDWTRHFTLHAVVERDADMATQFERVTADAGQLRHALCRRWRMNLLLRRPLPRGTGIPRGRCGAPGHSDRRARHEHRSG